MYVWSYTLFFLGSTTIIYLTKKYEFHFRLDSRKKKTF